MTSFLVFASVLTQLSWAGEMAAPQVDKMEPKSGKPGTVLVVTGVSLHKEKVDEVYLTDHRFDLKVKVLEQTSTTIKLRIPPFIKPGRHQLLFLTAGETPTYLEQPAYVQVEELPTPPDKVEVTATVPKPAPASAPTTETASAAPTDKSSR
ncbi:hypothetical protein F183_A46480 [Bryobacterales bacterium F-183]|nr:hypothetical protein F183_A46480 [Bryobacterales bacterium F-183]